MKFIKRLLLLLFILVCIYNVWASWGKVGADALLYPANFKADTVRTVGVDSGKGNMIGFQPILSARDYASEKAYYQSMANSFANAQQLGILNHKTIVVLPEYIGSWLVAANEKKSIYSDTAIADAMNTIVASNLFKFSYCFFTAPNVKDKAKYAAFAMKAKAMAQIYQRVFSSLAKEYKVTIVAGSLVLPSPEVDTQGKLQTGKGQLYNTSVVFDANGNIIQPLVKKIFPVDDEAGFTGCGITAQSPVFNTPAGKLGVLVCADSWYPKAYAAFNEDVKMIAVPSLGATDDVWNASWNGYNGFSAPPDVDTTDYHKLTEGQAWQKYSMGARASKAGIHYGMNVFFTGALWNKKAEGRVLVLNNDSLTVFSPDFSGRIINLWIN